MITFESKLKKLKHGGIKVYSIKFGESFAHFSSNKVLISTFSSKNIDLRKRAADAPARLPGKKSKQRVSASKEKRKNARFLDKVTKTIIKKVCYNPWDADNQVNDSSISKRGLRPCGYNSEVLSERTGPTSKLYYLTILNIGSSRKNTTNTRTMRIMRLTCIPKKTLLQECCIGRSLIWFRIKDIKLCSWFKGRIILLSGDVAMNPGPEHRHGQVPDPRAEPGQGPGVTNGGRAEGVRPNDTRDEQTKGKVQLKALTYNVRGLSDQNKVRHLINYFNKDFVSKDYDTVIALQETNVIKEGILPYLWRGNLSLTAGTGNSKGCITLLSSHLNVIESKEYDERSHVLVCQRNDSNFANYVIPNVYAPNPHNNEKIDFF